jgi:hypothetical protein
MDNPNLTWACHICGDVRPDDKISVYSKPLMLAGGVTADENIRYCNDKQSCIDAAPHYSHFDPKPIAEADPEKSRWTPYLLMVIAGLLTILVAALVDLFTGALGILR